MGPPHNFFHEVTTKRTEQSMTLLLRLKENILNAQKSGTFTFHKNMNAQLLEAKKSDILLNYMYTSIGGKVG